MLKLLKYEWKASARACLPIYGATLAIALINRILSMAGLENLLHGIPQLLAAFAYFGVMVAVFVVTAVILIQRFYKSLLGDEGYLMFTLPVTVSQHIWAKAIVAFVMCILSGATAFLSVVIMAISGFRLSDVTSLLGDLFRAIGEYPQGILYALELLLLMAVSCFFGILFVYLCIALGHLAKKHRVAMAVVWYFVLLTVLELLLGLVMLSGDGGVSQGLFGWVNHMDPMASVHVVMLLLIAGAAVPAALSFFGTRYILKNKLNLD